MVGTMFHVFAIYCMALNPTQCIRHEIIASSLVMTSTITACGKGGAIYAMMNPEKNIGGVLYKARGGVKCEFEEIGDRDGQIQAWVDEEKARLRRVEPQIK
jgi:hypothetical protein